MTIYSTIGLPGHGKTLYVVGEHVVKELKRGRVVVTNIPLCVPRLSEYCGVDVAPLVELLTEENCGGAEPFSQIEHFRKFDQWRSDGSEGFGPIYVIDECHKPLAVCAGMRGIDHPITHWFAEHRHVGADVVLLTQGRKDVPAAIRSRVEVTLEFRKATAFGFSNRYAMLTFLGASDKSISVTPGKYEKEWFGLYQSRRLGVAEAMPKVKNVFMSWRLALLALMFVGTLAYVATHGVGVPGWGKSKEEKKPNVQDQHGAAGASPPAAQATASAPGVSAAAHSPRLDAAKSELDTLKAEYELAIWKNARLPEGGEVVPGEGAMFGGGPGVVVKPAGKTLTHRYDQIEVRIEGSILVNARREYWLELRRDGQVWRQRSSDLEPFGFAAMAISECLLWLKGAHGSYKVTCSGYNVIAGQAEQAVQRPPAVVMHAANGSVQGQSRAASEPAEPLGLRTEFRDRD